MSESSGLGARIKALRLERDWTQSELARLSGISQSNINLIESGTRTDIKYDTIVGIARAFRISTDELLGYDKDAIPEPALGTEDRRRLDAVEEDLRDLSAVVKRGFAESANQFSALKSALQSALPKKQPRRKHS